MIIQAGFDFEVLARPFIVQDGKLMPHLVVICVDTEMRFNSVEVVADDFSGSLAPFQDAVLFALDPEHTRYFAIAHPGRFSEYDVSEPIIDEARALASKAAERGMQLIGHFAIDETGYMSAQARSFFDQYPGYEDLPRTMFHWAHSKLGKCG
ncbi:hypothetical protein [Arthrobacter sp. UYEF3]|uniref:hypothetical protein n=1 Tax=Arthrobacter sp. UYEF3 TaxID=1756365 RepID=UPI003398279C